MYIIIPKETSKTIISIKKYSEKGKREHKIKILKILNQNEAALKSPMFFSFSNNSYPII